MSHTALDPAGPWTLDQLADLPDDGRRYEVVDGHLVVTPPPSQGHQYVGSRLLAALSRVCPPEWEVVYEMALPLGTDGRVPDLSVVRRKPLPPPRPPYPSGPEDFGLVIEITSPSTRKTDLFAKPGEYAEAGIPLFWRIDLEPVLAIHAFRLEGSSYVAAAELLAPWGPVQLDLTELTRGQERSRPRPPEREGPAVVRGGATSGRSGPGS